MDFLLLMGKQNRTYEVMVVSGSKLKGNWWVGPCYVKHWLTPTVVLWKRFHLSVLNDPLGTQPLPERGSPPTLTPDCVGGGGWAVGGGAFVKSCRKHMLFWAFISELQLEAVYVDPLMANWCSMCKDTVSCMRRLWVATWVCLNMIPISTVNLVNSVGKKKEVQPENQPEQWLEIIEATTIGW